MLCPKCTSQIPDDSLACPRCRARIIDRSPALAATDISRDLPEQEKRIRSLLMGIVLAVAGAALAGMVANRVHSRRLHESTSALASRIEHIPVAKTQIVLKPGTPVSFGFPVPSGCRSAALQMQFVPGGERSRETTQITVFDEASYANWRNHTASRAIYTGKIRSAITNLSLPAEPKRYFLVFSQAATSLPTTLQADVELLCGLGMP